jgi:hypothetical protein
MSHTPGPWRFGPNRDHPGQHFITSVKHGWLLARVHGFNAGDVDGPKGYIPAHSEETDGNARLIAAAPDLLEALQMMIAQKGMVCDCGIAEEVFDKARAAITKAEGN